MHTAFAAKDALDQLASGTSGRLQGGGFLPRSVDGVRRGV
jgi:hypothetical protein